MPIKKDAYDYIIAGAGTAGCVLANRLSENPDVSVLLLEAGPESQSIFLRMPSGFAHAINSGRFDWNYLGEHEPYLDDRRLDCPRGRVLGGSSAINAMCFVRGHPLDFDGWANSSGYADWSYNDCLPYFKKLESFDGPPNPYRGSTGPVSVVSPAFSNPLCDVFAEAIQQTGYKWNPDPNGASQEGFGPMDQTIRNGYRESAANAYLGPVRGRSNLDIQCDTVISRISMSGTRATGVLVYAGRQARSVHCLRETILCAGAIDSPKLLMLSGIGPAGHLKEMGIDPVHDLPGVGHNLQDHVNVNIKFECTEPVSHTRLLEPHRKALVGLQWLLSRKGPGATNHFELAGYIKSGDSVAYPNLQLLFIPLLVDDNGKAPKQAHGFQVALSQLRSKSRGRIRLKSANPADAPSILFNYLQSPQDLEELRAGISKTRAIFSAAAFEPYVGEEIAPGKGIDDPSSMDQFIRSTLRSTKHPCGSCRMGRNGDAVVDDQGRVHGIEQLRVVDASIMPHITSGNTNAPTMMIAEKIADRVLGNTPLQPEPMNTEK